VPRSFQAASRLFARLLDGVRAPVYTAAEPSRKLDLANR